MLQQSGTPCIPGGFSLFRADNWVMAAKQKEHEWNPVGRPWLTANMSPDHHLCECIPRNTVRASDLQTTIIDRLSSGLVGVQGSDPHQSDIYGPNLLHNGGCSTWLQIRISAFREIQYPLISPTAHSPIQSVPSPHITTRSRKERWPCTRRTRRLQEIQRFQKNLATEYPRNPL